MHTFGQMFVCFVSLCAIRSHSGIQLLLCLAGPGLAWLLVPIDGVALYNLLRISVWNSIGSQNNIAWSCDDSFFWRPPFFFVIPLHSVSESAWLAVWLVNTYASWASTESKENRRNFIHDKLMTYWQKQRQGKAHETGDEKVFVAHILCNRRRINDNRYLSIRCDTSHTLLW